MFAQRFRALPLVYLLLATLCAVPASVSGQPETATEPPAAAESPAAAPSATVAAPPQPGQAAKTDGTLHVVVFDGTGAASVGANVTTSAGQTAATDAFGSVLMKLPAGQYTLSIVLPDGSPAREVEGVIIASGQSSEVIATALPDGGVDADVMLPESAKVEQEAEQTAAAEVAKPPGILQGRVLEAEGQAPVEGASIFVAGQEVEAKTSDVGGFEMTLPEGTYILSVIHPKYSTQTVRDVEVKSEGVANISIELTPVAIELQDFVVTAPHISGGVASMIEERKNSAAMSDSIGAEDIAKLPTSDAAGAAQRVVGATIVGGRFVYVRGLGERYSNALLNGAPLPSPEPDRAAVPLDLFPSQVLESLDISKTFTPDVPGDFAGGSVRITTRDVPEKEQFAVTLGGSLNTNSSFKKSWAQQSSSTDFLGFDDGMRSQPDVPSNYRLKPAERLPEGGRLGSAELLEEAKKFDSPLYPERKTNWPNYNGSIAYGNGWDLGKDVKVGALASLIYRRDYKYKDEILRSYQADVTEESVGVQLLQDYDSETTVHAVRWGAFGSSAITIGDNHKVSLIGMRSQLADATTRLLGGSNTFKNADVRTIRMDYVSRSLTFGQLQGTHKFPVLNEAELKWLGSLARAERDEGDTRDTVFQRDLTEGSPYNFIADNGSGRHYYANQFENALTLGLDWKQPILDDWFDLEMKAGALATMKDREFRARNFTSEVLSSAPAGATTCGTSFHPVGCPQAVFGGDALGSVIRVNETTTFQDSYNADLSVTAGYLMATTGFGEQWKVIGGLRAEQTDQTLQLYDPFKGELLEDDPDEPRGADLHQLDLLPALAVVYSPIDDLNIRAAGSITLARPQLRELAPFPYVEYFGGPTVTGNPQLDLTRIQNADLRVEYFPTAQEILAASLFAKRFVKPIEKLQTPASEGFAETYANSPGATLFGIELEARHSLDFVDEALEDFSILGSLMLAKSQIEIDGGANAGFLTNPDRPMMLASPWVVQAAVDYDNNEDFQFRVLYNVVGATLVAVGTENLDDTYQHPIHGVDFTLSKRLGENFRVKANIKNLLNSEFLQTIGSDSDGPVVRKYREGASFSLSLSYNN